MRKLFSVFDSKAEAYLAIFEAPTRGAAMRTIASAAATQDTLLGKYPADYSLMEIGEFDEKTGRLEATNGPVFVVSVGDLIQGRNQAPELVRPLGKQVDLEEVIAEGNA